MTMTTPRNPVSLEEQIDQWRSYLRRRQTIHSVDVTGLEKQLREQMASLVNAGLAADEAFLVAVKRMGSHDALTREFARANSNRLWKQIQSAPSDAGESLAPVQTEVMVAFCLAVAAAVAIKVPALFGLQLDEHNIEGTRFYLRNASLLLLPLLALYFAWKQRLETRTLRWLAVAFVAAGIFANIHSPGPVPLKYLRDCTCQSRSG